MTILLFVSTNRHSALVVVPGFGSAIGPSQVESVECMEPGSTSYSLYNILNSRSEKSPFDWSDNSIISLDYYYSGDVLTPLKIKIGSKIIIVKNA